MESFHVTQVEAMEAVDGVDISFMVTGDRMSVLHYHIEPGAAVPEHSHPHEQVGYVISGQGEFSGPDGAERLSEGDSYLLPGDEPHKVENIGTDILEGIDVFSPPRPKEDY